jgi:hypothetical protein
MIGRYPFQNCLFFVITFSSRLSNIWMPTLIYVWKTFRLIIILIKNITTVHLRNQKNNATCDTLSMKINTYLEHCNSTHLHKTICLRVFQEIYRSRSTFKFRFWRYLVNVITETRRVPKFDIYVFILIIHACSSNLVIFMFLFL